MKTDRVIVKIRVLKTAAALKKMIEACIARDIAQQMQGRTLRAMLCSDSGVNLVNDQGFPGYWLPPASYQIFVSRAAALAQTKRLAGIKAKTPRHRPFRIKK